MYSAKLHASGEFSVYLGHINGSLRADNIEIIKHFCSELQIPIQIRGFNFDYDVQVSHIPIQAYIRILWLDNLDNPFLWLDSDTLLLENWQNVFQNLDNTNLNLVIHAALDTDIIETRLNAFPNNSAYRRGRTTYFNDGVFLAYPKNWRAMKFHLAWPEIAARYQELGFEHHEQDVLNYMLFKNKEILQSSFNSLVMQGSKIEQCILHFTGQPKPWHFDKNAQKYFLSIESLKHKNGNGAFGGLNWLFEYQNYWRHERALLSLLSSDVKLGDELQKLYGLSRRPLMERNDFIKYKLLLAIGRKWGFK
jgi:lipopolysaccharide biosynthesis glycosyltransferase